MPHGLGKGPVQVDAQPSLVRRAYAPRALRLRLQLLVVEGGRRRASLGQTPADELSRAIKERHGTRLTINRLDWGDFAVIGASDAAFDRLPQYRSPRDRPHATRRAPGARQAPPLRPARVEDGQDQKGGAEHSRGRGRRDSRDGLRRRVETVEWVWSVITELDDVTSRCRTIASARNRAHRDPRKARHGRPRPVRRADKINLQDRRLSLAMSGNMVAK